MKITSYSYCIPIDDNIANYIICTATKPPAKDLVNACARVFHGYMHLAICVLELIYIASYTV